MSTRTVVLVRHPETDWNRQRRYQGRTGRPCTGDIEASASAVAGVIRRLAPDLLVTSPTAHARALAESLAPILAPRLGVRVEDDWREIDHGAWEGLTYETVVERFGSEAARRFDDPSYAGHGGETLVAAGSRIGRGWEALLAGTSAVTVIVTHATPIRLMLCRCLGLSLTSHWRLRIDPLGISRIDVTGREAVVAAVNAAALP